MTGQISGVSERPLRIMLVAGEPSGDALGAQIMAQLKAITQGRVTLIGVGGRDMRAMGLQSLFSIDETAVMGVRDVAPRFLQLLSRIRQTASFAIEHKPDICVLIDSTDFMRRVAGRIKKHAPGLKVVKYVSPQIWASRPGRAKAMARVFDHILCLFDFEVPMYEKVGLAATFVGNPVIERAPPPGLGAALRERLHLTPSDRVIVLLPGSRRSEIRFLWPVFREAVERTLAATGPATLILPTVQTVAAQVREAVAAWGRRVLITEDTTEKWAAFEAANVALAASGTVATELALTATPTVVGYKVGWLTAAGARRIMTVKYITLLNIILDRPAIPEFVQEECTAENLSREMISLLTNPVVRMTQIGAAEEALRKLGHGAEQPSSRAARAILALSGR
ncbi:MAG TPA: lipid-A-disaccharide synthase [Alphaproteobacteria bacterium]|nr:lipid-A-disaccharide synthase [Alphaproteobacteria bacterium]HAJ46602.1 lipid-A-disaccharide synthase [Alphaproteobacteria bacterium]